MLAHPHFSSFLAVLPKDAKWQTVSTWLNNKEKTSSPPPEAIQKAVDTLHAYERERVTSQAATKEKLRSLSQGFTLTPALLTNKLRLLRKLPPRPETLDAKPFTANPTAKAEFIAPLIWKHPQVVPDAKEANPIPVFAREELESKEINPIAPSYPPIANWATRGAPPSSYLSAAMRYISQTGEVRPFITEALQQIANMIAHEKIRPCEQFYCIENTVSAIKQWQLIDVQDSNKVDYLPILKPALLACMENYRQGYGKNIDRYLLIRQLITKTKALNTSEELLNLLVSTKHQLLEEDRRADASFLHSLLGWRRNSSGESRLLDHIDTMMAGVTAMMVAEGKGAVAEACIEKANKDMLRSLIKRKKITVELRTQLIKTVNGDSTESYHPPLIKAQYHLDNNPQKKHLHSFFNSFKRTENLRQAMKSKKTTSTPENLIQASRPLFNTV